MKFYIVFKTEDKEKHLAEYIGKPGLDMLDILREAFPILNKVELDKISIDSTCPLSKFSRSILISEEEARICGHFRGNTEVTVTVPEFALSRFIKWHLEQSYNTEIKQHFFIFTNKIKIPSYAYCTQGLDIKALFLAWQEAGFPLKWKI